MGGIADERVSGVRFGVRRCAIAVQPMAGGIRRLKRALALRPSKQRESGGRDNACDRAGYQCRKADPQPGAHKKYSCFRPCKALGLSGANSDVMAIEEIRSTRKADAAWAAVTDGISGHIGGDWRVDLQSCGGELAQHVGFLWNAERVTLSDAEDVWQMNGAPSDPHQPCANNPRDRNIPLL